MKPKLPPLHKAPSKVVKLGVLRDWLRIFKGNYIVVMFVRELRVAMDCQSWAAEAIPLLGYEAKPTLSGETMELLYIAANLAPLWEMDGQQTALLMVGHCNRSLVNLLKYHESVGVIVEHLGTPAGREEFLDAAQVNLFIDNPECRATENEKNILRDRGLSEQKFESATIWIKMA